MKMDAIYPIKGTYRDGLILADIDRLAAFRCRAEAHREFHKGDIYAAKQWLRWAIKDWRRYRRLLAMAEKRREISGDDNG